MLRATLAAALLGSVATIGAVSAAAQDSTQAAGDGTRIAEIIVYGNDPCPRSTDDEVVVCARKPESERYRIPDRLRQGGSLQSRQAWAARARSFEVVGRTGTQSCSAVGPGGQTGCLQQIIDQARAEAREAQLDDTPPSP